MSTLFLEIAADGCALIYYNYVIIVGTLGLFVVLLSPQYDQYQRLNQDLAFSGFLSNCCTGCPWLDTGPWLS